MKRISFNLGFCFIRGQEYTMLPANVENRRHNSSLTNFIISFA